MHFCITWPEWVNMVLIAIIALIENAVMHMYIYLLKLFYIQKDDNESLRFWLTQITLWVWRDYFSLGLKYTVLFMKCHPSHDDVIKWKYFPRNWPFVRGIYRSPVKSPHNGQRRGALIFSLICAWINGWVNNGEAGDLRRLRTHYDVIVMNHDCLLGHIQATLTYTNHPT